ncbi:MAG: hypothetical protein ACTICQ_13470 [Glutamicibacter arilaitensis]|uniref:hypothetical protein n=1 Tax=Glutamicibacter arilaitensis TaxID=256701 RepID=UPI003FBA1182
MAYKVCMVDTGSWMKITDIDPLSGNWARALNSGRGGSLTLQAGDDGDLGQVIRSTTWPLETVVVVESDSRIEFAGFVTTTKYSWVTRQVTLTLNDIWWIFAKRFLLDNRTSLLTNSQLDWENIDARMMAKRAIEFGTNGGSSPEYELPIVLPPDSTGPLKRTVYGYDMETIQDVLDDAIESENGIDLDFRPRWAADGSLEWVMETNANKTRFLEWDLDAEDHNVTDFDFTVEGQGIGNIVYGLGEGSEVDMKVHAAKTPESVYLALERSVSFKDVKNTDTLRRRTLGEMVPTNGAIRQISMTINGDQRPGVQDLHLGSTVKWRADNDPWLLAGWSGEWELLEYSGSMTDSEVKLEFQGREGD